ncbi:MULTISPECIES: hypothetical protein [Methylocaldum]|jgi:hypothetical protein|uniref:hypothetical protein n=1 Tax=unclassified Methylocaldum TaxID=2622260 RepID=UPI00098A4D61|nr:hypothetical protein [Methylocaldum sp. 14B]MDV3242291.1 hypothetical protein [Methylocaldum sp.]MVF21747.1 hypothetical protein [Methylocaldum sp. BRCS4]
MQPEKQRVSIVRWARWAIVIAVALVVLIVAALFIVGRKPPTEEVIPPVPPAPQEPGRAPIPEPQVEVPAAVEISIAGQGGPGCEAEKNAHEVIVKEMGGKDIFDAYEKGVLLTDEEGVTNKYYLDVDGVPEDKKSQLPVLFATGNHLKVRYVICGSGGLRFLTSVQAQPNG